METKICSTCKVEQPVDAYYKNGKTPKGGQRYRYDCKTCYNGRKKLSYVEKKNEKTEIILAYFGKLACQTCGYDKCIAALDLHHRDPTEKDRNIASMTLYNVDRIMAEIIKCDLLCSNCHRELHYNSSV